jgi:hypothetical protein
MGCKTIKEAKEKTDIARSQHYNQIISYHLGLSYLQENNEQDTNEQNQEEQEVYYVEIEETPLLFLIENKT